MSGAQVSQVTTFVLYYEQLSSERALSLAKGTGGAPEKLDVNLGARGARAEVGAEP